MYIYAYIGLYMVVGVCVIFMFFLASFCALYCGTVRNGMSLFDLVQYIL